MDLDYFKKTFKLDSTSSEPMYKQISNVLLKFIIILSITSRFKFQLAMLG